MLTYGSYFSGGGIADAGAQEAGFNILLGVEINEKIANVYRMNYRNHLYVKSVIDIDPIDLPGVDWFHASPVCVNFSTLKTNREELDIDIDMANATIRYIEYHKPEFVTIENVHGYQKSYSWQIISKFLMGHYHITSKVVNMADYGVPQERKRFVALCRLTKKVGFPLVTHRKEAYKSWFDSVEKHVSWYEVVVDLIDEFEERKHLPKWFFWNLPDEQPAPIFGMFCNTTGKQMSKKGKGLRLIDKPAATMISSSYRNWYFVSNGKNYRFSKQALARMMSVPDWYKLPESNTLTGLVLGNGIPSLFMQRIGEHFLTEYEQSV